MWREILATRKEKYWLKDLNTFSLGIYTRERISRQEVYIQTATKVSIYIISVYYI